ncbi:MAG: hypothetical protein HC923_13715 [Myxococcales bacterium]|nr:hypothetical protein [Myxococcales bacterium]
MTAVVVSGLALAVERAPAVDLGGPIWLVGTTALGLALGVLFWFFVGEDREERQERVFLATVGVIIFASGLASAVGISPLFLSAIAGIVVSLLPESTRLHIAVTRLERPALIVFSIFAGALLRPTFGVLLLLPLFYFLLRVAALRFSAGLASWVIRTPANVPRLGSGLVAQGVIAAAIAVNYAQVLPSLGAAISMTIIPGLILADVFSFPPLRRLLADSGELGHAEASASPPLRASA